jgi:hypothetical protein
MQVKRCCPTHASTAYHSEIYLKSILPALVLQNSDDPAATHGLTGGAGRISRVMAGAQCHPFDEKMSAY